MVSFRFHLVSLVAVFLALALGIGMGATVIDKATVDSLKRRVASVEQQRDAANQQGSDLNKRLSRAGEWESAAGALLIDNALRDVPVTIIAVRGADTKTLDEQRKALQDAGAAVQGTVWFTAKASLSDPDVLTQLQQALGAPAADAAQVRQALQTRVAAVLAGASPGSTLKDLQRAGVLEWESGLASDIANANFAGSRVLMYSAAQANVPNDQIATPLVKLLAAQPTRRVVAVEAGREPDSHSASSGSRAVWLDVLRNDTALDGRLSTVDDIEADSGRVATVIALQMLANGKAGDFGVADSASSPLPKPAT